LSPSPERRVWKTLEFRIFYKNNLGAFRSGDCGGQNLLPNPEIKKIFLSVFVEITAEWDLNHVGTTGFAYVNGEIQKSGSSQACPETLSVYSYSSVLFFLTR